MTLAVRIRELRESDSPYYIAWINDRELVKFNSNYAPVSDFQHRDWFAAVSRRKDMRIFTIEVEHEGQAMVIGSCSLRNLDSLTRSAELQIRIGEAAFRDKGLGTKVVRMLLEHGFDDMNLNRIHLEVFAANERAIQTYRKCGFVVEGVKRAAAFRGGHYQDIMLMSVLKSEYDSHSSSAG